MNRKLLGLILASVATVALVGGFFAARSFRRQGLLSALPPIPMERFNPSARVVVSKALDDLKEEPLRADRWGDLGYCLAANGVFTEPGPCFARAEELDPANYRWPHLFAIVTINKDRPAAVAALKRVLKVQPNVVPTLGMLVEAYLEDGADKEADALLRPLVTEKTNDAQLLWLMARIEANAGNSKRALEFAKRAAAIPPQRRKVHTLLAQLQQAAGNAEEARKETRLLELLPPIEEEARWEDPIARQIQRYSRIVYVIAEQARTMIGANRAEEAIHLLEGLAAEDQRQAQVQAALALAKAHLGDLKAAEAVLDAVPEKDDPNVVFTRAAIALLKNNPAEAAELFEKVTKLRPTDEKVRKVDAVYVSQGRCLQTLKKSEEAAIAYQNALKQNPGNLEAMLLLADVHLESGRKAEARRLLDDAALLEPNEEAIKEMQKLTEK